MNALVDPEQWRRVQPILDEALALPADERREWLERACPDPDLRAVVERLLDADASRGGVLDCPSHVFLAEMLRDIEGNAARQHDPSRASQIDRPLASGKFPPGTVLAHRYRIVSLVGRGGMGEVYRADDLKLGQAVALKFLPLDLQENTVYRRRFLEEVRLARQVSHPNVCRVYDVGECDGRHFLSMEYIDGENLESVVKRIGHLPRHKALDIAQQLCAGLHAAHQLGILHCDLKPANVMLDGRGQVRITDFGLAVAVHGTALRHAGTPGYMSPEQFEGREATVRSDLYALGLVLYELFTGRRAFQVQTVEALRRLQNESSPTAPSLLVDAFDPAVERAILRCLERDPVLRPASARELAAMLPNGDRLAAATAAGETPLPEVVAAAGPEGALSGPYALTLVGIVGVMLVVLTVLNDRASNLGWVPMPRSAAALEDNARRILERLGYDEPPVDRVWGFNSDNPTLREYVRRTDSSPGRWEVLRHPRQFDVMFFYRQAPLHLKPLAWNGFVDLWDPPPNPGDVQMGTDLHGRLFWLQVLPAEASPPGGDANSPWPQLFDVAGLDMGHFTPVPPSRHPPVSADARAAWSGTLEDFGPYPVRVEAAALRGRPVYFELVVPWDRYWDVSNSQPSPTGPAFGSVWRFYWVGVGSLVLFAFLASSVLVVRNWLSGRGDRHGAFRAGAVVFCVRLGMWLVGGHHVPSLAPELELFVTALGKSLTDAAATWCLYIALEPYARRLHPRLLVSWTRILRGRFTDPLVGRDILYGVVASLGVILFWGQLYVLVPHGLGLTAPPAPMPNPIGSPPYFFVLDTPPPLPLLGGRHAVAAAIGAVLRGVSISIVFATFVLGMYLLFRRAWAAMGIGIAFVSVIGWPIAFGGATPVGLVCSFVGALSLFSWLRYGLLGSVVTTTCMALWSSFPVTARVSAPYFETGLLAVLPIFALAVFGAFTASRHSPQAAAK